MEPQLIYIICRAYEDGKLAAKKQQFSNTNPYNKNTVAWLAWIYGWEFGVSKYLKKYKNVH